MSACLLTQLTAPTKPAACPLLLLLASPAAAQRVGEHGERREGHSAGTRGHALPQGQNPTGKLGQHRLVPALENHPATVNPPRAQTPLTSLSTPGGTLQLVLTRSLR